MNEIGFEITSVQARDLKPGDWLLIETDTYKVVSILAHEGALFDMTLTLRSSIGGDSVPVVAFNSDLYYVIEFTKGV